MPTGLTLTIHRLKGSPRRRLYKMPTLACIILELKPLPIWQNSPLPSSFVRTAAANRGSGSVNAATAASGTRWSKSAFVRRLRPRPRAAVSHRDLRRRHRWLSPRSNRRTIRGSLPVSRNSTAFSAAVLSPAVTNRRPLEAVSQPVDIEERGWSLLTGERGVTAPRPISCTFDVICLDGIQSDVTDHLECIAAILDQR